MRKLIVCQTFRMKIGRSHSGSIKKFALLDFGNFVRAHVHGNRVVRASRLFAGVRALPEGVVSGRYPRSMGKRANLAADCCPTGKVMCKNMETHCKHFVFFKISNEKCINNDFSIHRTKPQKTIHRSMIVLVSKSRAKSAHGTPNGRKGILEQSVGGAICRRRVTQ